MDRYFLTYFGMATHSTGPYDTEEEAEAAVQSEKQPQDKACVLIGPLPIDELPATKLYTFE